MPRRTRNSPTIEPPNGLEDTFIPGDHPPDKTKVEAPPVPNPQKVVAQMVSVEKQIAAKVAEQIGEPISLERTCAYDGHCVFLHDGRCTACDRGKQFI